MEIALALGGEIEAEVIPRQPLVVEGMFGEQSYALVEEAVG